MEFSGNETQNLYLMMNKPAGFVCSAVSDSHKTVYQLLSSDIQFWVQNAKRGHRLHTVGRLDCETSGLLLLTTDGNFSHQLTSPDFQVTKTYLATLERPGSLDYVTRAAQGLILPAEKKAPEQKTGSVLMEPWYAENQGQKNQGDRPLEKDLLHWKVTVTEGKFHEVRRIFRALGNEVVELKRVSIGKWALPSNLKEGDYITFQP